MAQVQELSQPTYRTRSVGDPYSARFLQKTSIHISLFKEQITAPCEKFQPTGAQRNERALQRPLHISYKHSPTVATRRFQSSQRKLAFFPPRAVTRVSILITLQLLTLSAVGEARGLNRARKDFF